MKKPLKIICEAVIVILTAIFGSQVFLAMAFQNLSTNSNTSSSGGGGATPSLSQVTAVGASTTAQVTLNGGLIFTNATGSGTLEVSGDAHFYSDATVSGGLLTGALTTGSILAGDISFPASSAFNVDEYGVMQNNDFGGNALGFDAPNGSSFVWSLNGSNSLAMRLSTSTNGLALEYPLTFQTARDMSSLGNTYGIGKASYAGTPFAFNTANNTRFIFQAGGSILMSVSSTAVGLMSTTTVSGNLLPDNSTRDIGFAGGPFWHTLYAENVLPSRTFIVPATSTPATAGTNGQMRYNNGTNKIQCYQNFAWTDCIPSGTNVWTEDLVNKRLTPTNLTFDYSIGSLGQSPVTLMASSTAIATFFTNINNNGGNVFEIGTTSSNGGAAFRVHNSDLTGTGEFDNIFIDNSSSTNGAWITFGDENGSSQGIITWQNSNSGFATSTFIMGTIDAHPMVFLTNATPAFAISQTDQSGQFFGNVDIDGVLSLPGGNVTSTLAATSISFGNAILLAGACTSTATTVTGAKAGMAVVSTPQTYPGDAAYWKSMVTAANTVTTYVCAAVGLTPTASVYSIRVTE